MLINVNTDVSVATIENNAVIQGMDRFAGAHLCRENPRALARESHRRRDCRDRLAARQE